MMASAISAVQEVLHVQVSHQVSSFSQFLTNLVREGTIFRPERGRYYVPRETYADIVQKAEHLSVKPRKRSGIGLKVLQRFNIPDDVPLAEFYRNPLRYLDWDQSKTADLPGQGGLQVNRLAQSPPREFHRSYTGGSGDELEALRQQFTAEREKLAGDIDELKRVCGYLLSIFKKATSLGETPTTGLIEVARELGVPPGELEREIREVEGVIGGV
ncbi:MAG: hypothetical protein ACTSU5_06740 [Promethearchaeota archaeon]